MATWNRIRTVTGIQYSDPDEYLNVGQRFELKVSQRLIPHHSIIDKFGENPEIDTGTFPEDIWEAGGLYNYDADGTAPIVSLVSDNIADTEPITITGLDIDGNEVEQTITLTGTTRVALTTPLWRVHIMENVGTTNLVGTVYCYVGTGGVPLLANTRAIIDNGNNRTLMALYTIPKGKIGFLYRGELGASRSVTAGEARCAYFSRRFGSVFTIKKRVNLSNAGTSIYKDARSFPDIVPALTDIKLSIESVSANGMGVFGTFDILLIDQEIFADWLLAALGQLE